MHPLEQIMNPRSIAFYGASSNPLKMGSIQLANVLEGGYRGEVFPIHPSEKEIMGVRAYRSIAQVGKPVDLVQLVLPTGVVPEILEECGKAGIKRAIVISGGFGETQREEGARLERRMKEIARRYGIRFLGPNCVGVQNGTCRLNTTTIAGPPFGGRIALVSQSGAYTAMLNPYLRSSGIRISATVSVGNEADIDLVDCLEYFREKEEVRAVGLYVEAVRRPREFISAARLTAAEKPVVAVYVGGNEAGSRSSLSHTAAVSGPDELYDGLLRQAGVIRAEDMDQMIDFLWALSAQPVPSGDRMAVITNSGGPGTSLAYHLEKKGLRVPVFSSGLRSRLKEMTGPLTSVVNPIDMTFETNIYLYKQLTEAVFESGEVDGALIYGLFGASDIAVNLKKRLPDMASLEKSWDEGIRDFIGELGRVPARTGKPLLVMSFLGTGSMTVRSLVEADVPVYPSASRAVAAMRALLEYGTIRKKLETAI